MKIVFINLHMNVFFVKTIDLLLRKAKIIAFKHKFLLDYAIESKMDIYNYVTDFVFSLFKGRFHGRIKKIFSVLESNSVLRKNGLKQIKKIKSLDILTPDDIVLVHYYFPDQMEALKNIKAKKVVLGNHFIRLSYDGDFDKLGVDYFVNEIDLSKNIFINKYFNLKREKHLIMPYIFQERFVVKKDFRDRRNKAMAVGTCSTVSGAGYEEYERFAGTPWVQPMRKEILEKKDTLSDIIDSFISYIHEDAKEKEINKSENKISKLMKVFHNYYYGGNRQTKYYSFDMVEKFNEYKMFVCPEELVGMPGIGFVEGMACGCAYIGLDSEMYTCLGLIPKKHYIAYNGTLEDLRAKCEYYMQNEAELENIAMEGCKFVRTNFNCHTVAENFFNKITGKADENV